MTKVMPDLYDRFLQWGMNNIAGPMAPGLANQAQQNAQAASADAQSQMNLYLGPEAQGQNPVARFGHGLASLGQEALAAGNKVAGGFWSMNPGQALLSAANPKLAGAVMGAQAAPGFWDHIRHMDSTPDATQTALLGAALFPAGGEEGMPEMLPERTAMPEVPVSPRPAPVQQGNTVNVTPSMYLNKIGAGDASSIMLTDADRATVQHFRNQIRSGAAVDPVSITHDEAGNVVEADGRHRALAAHLEGMDRIPVQMNRATAAMPDAMPEINADEIGSLADAVQDPALFNQAQKELGPQATLPEVAQHTQALQQAAKPKVNYKMSVVMTPKDAPPQP
jgi:hypothetical protein